MKTSLDTLICGEGIILRALRESDLDGNWYGWFNDPEVNFYQNKGIFPNTREKQAAYFSQLKTDASQVTLAIECTSDGKHIGNVTLKDLDWIHRTAELGIVIGEKEYWGRGFGAQGWWLITRYGFLTLNLNRIWARIFKGNDRSIQAALRSGFLVEGEMKEHFYRNGVYYNLVLVGITAARWRECFGTDPDAQYREAIVSRKTGPGDPT